MEDITVVINARDRGKRNRGVVGTPAREVGSGGGLPREGKSPMLEPAYWKLVGMRLRLSKS